MRIFNKKKIPASVLFRTDKRLSDEAKLLVSKCARSTARDYLEEIKEEIDTIYRQQIEEYKTQVQKEMETWMKSQLQNLTQN